MTGTLSRDTGATTQVDERLGTEARDFLGRPHQLFIDGKWVDAADGRTFGTYDPATGAEITQVAHGGPEDVNRAVAAARRAFDDGAWATRTPNQREQSLWRIGDLLDAKAELFGQIEALDNGKSVAIATAVDVAWAADVFRYYAGWSTKIEGSTVNVSMPFAGDKQFHAYTQRVPVGVCGQIVPWNFPLLMAAWKLAPALATGNTLVLKPAEQTPLTALLLGEDAKRIASTLLCVMSQA